jgi:large subunit ribosomal protein L18e
VQLMKKQPEKDVVVKWLAELEASRASKERAGLSKRIYKFASKPSRQRPQVNIYKINRATGESDSVIVPGKVLSIGLMDHKVRIAAMEFSESAMAELKRANCSVVPLKDALKAKNAKIIV